MIRNEVMLERFIYSLKGEQITVGNGFSLLTVGRLGIFIFINPESKSSLKLLRCKIEKMWLGNESLSGGPFIR